MNLLFRRRRFRAFAILACAGVLQMAVTLFGSAIGISQPQWIAFPIGLVVWSLAFWCALADVRGKPEDVGE